MDSFMLRDEAARDRVRQAEEFLDPRSCYPHQMESPLPTLADSIAD